MRLPTWLPLLTYLLLALARGRGGSVAPFRFKPQLYLGKQAVRRAEEFFQPVVAQLPRKNPQPEPVLEELGQ